MANTEPAVMRAINMRDILAGLITGISILGVIALASAVVVTSDGTQRSGVAKEVLAVILPLLGSWVGTVLAFYFSKENFEAATRSVTELAKQITPQERLVSTSVRDKMIPKDKLFFRRLPPDQIKLVETLDALDAAKKGNRLPVLGDKDVPGYVIHRSMIDKYLADKARQGADPAKVLQLTLKDLLTESPDVAKAFDTSFATVAETASLADAKNAMDRLPHCQDIFVTRRGTKDEEVLGWVTNVVIADNSQV